MSFPSDLSSKLDSLLMLAWVMGYAKAQQTLSEAPYKLEPAISELRALREYREVVALLSKEMP